MKRGRNLVRGVKAANDAGTEVGIERELLEGINYPIFTPDNIANAKCLAKCRAVKLA